MDTIALQANAMTPIVGNFNQQQSMTVDFRPDSATSIQLSGYNDDDGDDDDEDDDDDEGATKYSIDSGCRDGIVIKVDVPSQLV